MMSCDKKENKYDLQIKFWKAYFNYYFILYIFIKAMLSIYIYLYIIYILKYLLLLSENKESYLYNYYIKQNTK